MLGAASPCPPWRARSRTMPDTTARPHHVSGLHSSLFAVNSAPSQTFLMRREQAEAVKVRSAARGYRRHRGSEPPLAPSASHPRLSAPHTGRCSLDPTGSTRCRRADRIRGLREHDRHGGGRLEQPPYETAARGVWPAMLLLAQGAMHAAC